jgi:hypothetical protein
MKQKLLFRLLGFFLFISQHSGAQVRVKSTAGDTATTNYTKLSLAFSAVNNGVHRGAVTITIYANITETDACRLQGSGAALYDSILIQGRGLPTPRVFTSTEGTLLLLDGAHNVTIDGFNPQDPGNKLTFINDAFSAWVPSQWGGGDGSTIIFNHGASNNVVRNCQLLCNGDAVIIMGMGGNSYNMIGNNDIASYGGRGAGMGIRNTGQVAYYNTGNVYRHNRIFNYGFAGYCEGDGAIQPVGCSRLTLIEGNEFFATSSDYTSYMAIDVPDPRVRAMRIIGNYIHDLRASLYGDYSGIGVGADSVDVLNNVIVLNDRRAIRTTGIWLFPSSLHARVTHNTVVVFGNSPSVGGSAAFRKSGESVSDTVCNNIFVNTRVQPTGQNYYHAAMLVPKDPNMRISFYSDHNLLFAAGTAASVTGVLYDELADVGIPYAGVSGWSVASNGNQHSISAMPLFMSETNVRLQPVPANSSLDNKGIPLSSVRVDFDGALRHPLTPDLGAFEFTVLATAVLRFEESLDTCSLQPNRIYSGARLMVISVRTESLQWRVFNAAGQHVKGFVQKLLAGTNELYVDLSGLSPGVYRLQGSAGKRSITLPFVKL